MWFHKESQLEKLLRTEKNLQIRILRYADMGIFTITEAQRDLALMPDEVAFLQSEVSRGEGFFSNMGGGSGSEYRYLLTLEGKSRLLEYDEMVLAQRNSREAKRLAIIAILISIAVGAVQLFWTQDVRIIN